MEFLLFLFHFYFGSPTQVSQDFRSLVAEMSTERASCLTFDEKATGAGLETDSGKDGHADRMQALAALSILEERPSQLPKGERAAGHYIEHRNALAKEPKKAEVALLLGEIRTECDVFFPLVQYQLLFKDVKKFNFSAAEKARLESVFRSYVEANIRGPGLSIISYAIRANLLQHYLEQTREPSAERDRLIGSLKAYLDKFEADRKALTAVYAEHNKFKGWLTGGYSVDYHLPETDIAIRLRKDLGPLVAQVFAKSPQ